MQHIAILKLFFPSIYSHYCFRNASLPWLPADHKFSFKAYSTNCGKITPSMPSSAYINRWRWYLICILIFVNDFYWHRCLHLRYILSRDTITAKSSEIYTVLMIWIPTVMLAGRAVFQHWFIHFSSSICYYFLKLKLALDHSQVKDCTISYIYNIYTHTHTYSCNFPHCY